MKKYQFNNLYDSVIITALLIAWLFLLIASIYGNYIQENTYGIIICMCIFGSGSLVLVIMILLKCYERWYIDDEKIISKHLLHQKSILRTSNLGVRKEKIRALLNYVQEAYIFSDGTTTITIYVNKKKQDVFAKPV